MLVLPLSSRRLALNGDGLLIETAGRVVQFDVSDRVGPGVGRLEGGIARSASGTGFGAS